MVLEEDFWKLKARINWISVGDLNNRFFHTTTLNRRQRNRILALKEGQGQWLYDRRTILQKVSSYLQNLFTTDNISTPRNITTHVDLPATNLGFSDEVPSENEIHKVVESFQPLNNTPTHVMQYLKLPTKITNKIDQI